MSTPEDDEARNEILRDLGMMTAAREVEDFLTELEFKIAERLKHDE